MSSPSVIGIVLLLAACANEPARPLQYRIVLDHDAMPGREGAEVFYNGRSLGEFRHGVGGKTHTETFEPAEGELISAAKLTAVYQTTCGAEQRPLVTTYTAETEEADRRSDYLGSTSVTFRLASPLTSSFVVLDNAGAKAKATISIGSRRFEVASGRQMKLPVIVGDCADARTIVINGKVVDPLPPTKPAELALIDVVGGHCYATGTIQYAAPGTNAVARDFPDHLVADGSRRVYVLPFASYVLETEDNTIRESRDTATRSQLKQVLCPMSKLPRVNRTRTSPPGARRPPPR